MTSFKFQASSFNSFALVVSSLILILTSVSLGDMNFSWVVTLPRTDDSDLMTLGDDYSVFQLYFPVSLRGPTKKVCHMSKPTVHRLSGEKGTLNRS